MFPLLLYRLNDILDSAYLKFTNGKETPLPSTGVIKLNQVFDRFFCLNNCFKTFIINHYDKTSFREGLKSGMGQLGRRQSSLSWCPHGTATKE